MRDKFFHNSLQYSIQQDALACGLAAPPMSVIILQYVFPHLDKIITDDLDGVINNSDLIIVANKEGQYADLPSRYPAKDMIDLVGIEGGFETSRERYQGFCW